MKLTKTNVDKRCVPPAPGELNASGKPKTQRLYMDDELKGFGLLVSAKTKAYVAQRQVNGRTVRVTVGRHGVFTPDKARHRARELLVRMTNGEDVNASKRAGRARSITLDEAAAIYREYLERRGRSPKTLKSFDENLRNHFGDWKQKPLAELTREMVRARHRRIGDRRGTYAANSAMRTFRAIYNRALRQHADLPPNPVINVDWYPERKRDVATPTDGLGDLVGRVMALLNPVRRDYFLFLLFTGMRREAVASICWEDADLDAGTLHVPSPKGGAARAFTLPLSDFLVELLRRRRNDNEPFFPGSPWAFPAHSRSGRISEPKEKTLPSPHAFRHTYVTAATAAGVNPYHLKLLTNHALPSTDVTAGYVGADLDALRREQQRVTDYLRQHADGELSR